ncbi:tetratricopeptide repeat protein [bacterium]|nr:tetratricopeptide repeat protein [bacterium]
MNSSSKAIIKTEDRDDLLLEGEAKCDEAISLVQEGDYSSALDSFDCAEDIFLKINDQHWLNFLRHEKFRVFQQLNRYEDALEITEKIIEGYYETMNRNGLSLILIHKSDILMEMGKRHDALASLNLAKAVIESEKLHDLKGYLNSNLAMVHMALEDFVSAIKALQTALNSYPEESNPSEYAWCLFQLGICYKKTYDYNSAESHLTASYQTYSRTSEYDMQKQVLEVLREIYAATNQLKKLSNLELI